VSKDKRNLTLLLGSYALGLGVMMAGLPLMSPWVFSVGVVLQVPMILFLLWFTAAAWREMP
jgi:uncharacterized membrane protein YedE/YeeE